MRVSMIVSASLDAVEAARSSPTGLRGRPRPPVWRWYSSLISEKTATRGEGLNCSATAAISDKRPERRKARRKRPDWARAVAKARYLLMMMVQEKTDAAARRMRTAKATGPELCRMSPSAEVWAAVGTKGAAAGSSWRNARRARVWVMLGSSVAIVRRRMEARDRRGGAKAATTSLPLGAEGLAFQYALSSRQ